MAAMDKGEEPRKLREERPALDEWKFGVSRHKEMELGEIEFDEMEFDVPPDVAEKLEETLEIDGIEQEKKYAEDKLEGKPEVEGTRESEFPFDKGVFEHLLGRIDANSAKLEFSYAFKCFQKNVHNSREYVVSYSDDGEDVSFPTNWVVIHTHYGMNWDARNRCHYATNITQNDEVSRKGEGSISDHLDTVMALKKCAMEKGGSCTAGDLYALDGDNETKFRSVIEKITPGVLCQRYSSQLRYLNGRFSIAPCFVNHVNFRFVKRCATDDQGRDKYARIFLPTVRESTFNARTHFFAAEDRKFYAFAKHPASQKRFDIWANNRTLFDNWGSPPEHHGIAELNPRDLVPLLQWLEKNRYGMLRKSIVTGGREKLKKFATDLIQDHRYWLAAPQKLLDQADMHSRGDDGDDDNDGSDNDDGNNANGDDDGGGGGGSSQ
jgi:hypothetical protein